MIAGIFHEGSGLGNQLHRYVMTRVLALDKGFEFGMVNPENFKGAEFLKLDMGIPVKDLEHEYIEPALINDEGNNVADYDWDGILHIKDSTLVDGNFEGEKYYKHHLERIREWLQIRPEAINTDLKFKDTDCVIGFRGGEYVGVRDLFLPQSYWNESIAIMRADGIKNFYVVTDDPETARQFFPDFQVTHDMPHDWVSVNECPNLIIANSSFFILPTLLNKNLKKVIAPLHWAGYNKGYWQQRQCQFEKFTYI